jgi:hypothetical protein
VTTKRATPFPRDADDWKFFNKNVPKVVKEHAEQGCKIVIFR